MLQANRSENACIPFLNSSGRAPGGSPIENVPSDIEIEMPNFARISDDGDEKYLVSPGWNGWDDSMSAVGQFDTNLCPNDWLSADSSEDGESIYPEKWTTHGSIQTAIKYTQRAASNHYCPACFTQFPALHLLERHAKDSGHKPFLCSAQGCGKAYPRRDTCIRHIATHKQSTHICTICTNGTMTKAFVRKDHWLQHMRACHPNDADLLERKHGYDQENSGHQEKRQMTRTILSEAFRNLEIDDERLSRLREKYESTRDLDTEQWTEVFATLALVEPGLLSAQTIERLKKKVGRASPL